MADVPDRFLKKCVIAQSGCMEWMAYKNNKGYGVFYCGWMKKNTLAHRWLWEFLKGPVSKGFFMDHLCRNPACVNPDHLEVVTPRENVFRGVSPFADKARRTNCINGHAFDVDNTVIRDGTRGCRACHNIRTLARYHRNREKLKLTSESKLNYIEL